MAVGRKRPLLHVESLCRDTPVHLGLVVVVTSNVQLARAIWLLAGPTRRWAQTMKSNLNPKLRETIESVAAFMDLKLTIDADPFAHFKMPNPRLGTKVSLNQCSPTRMVFRLAEIDDMGVN